MTTIHTVSQNTHHMQNYHEDFHGYKNHVIYAMPFVKHNSFRLVMNNFGKIVRCRPFGIHLDNNSSLSKKKVLYLVTALTLSVFETYEISKSIKQTLILLRNQAQFERSDSSQIQNSRNFEGALEKDQSAIPTYEDFLKKVSTDEYDKDVIVEYIPKTIKFEKSNFQNIKMAKHKLKSKGKETSKRTHDLLKKEAADHMILDKTSLSNSSKNHSLSEHLARIHMSSL
ncbi:MAG: hypothetical protein JHC93_08465 [Parachlamydiales bacterium]|nr:hypothetical protein [Parachlamydiales bacterium]